jgi:hypothetical protein
MKPDPFNVVAGALLITVLVGMTWAGIVSADKEVKEATSVTVMGTQVVVMSPEPGVTCYLRGMNGIFCMRR